MTNSLEYEKLRFKGNAIRASTVFPAGSDTGNVGAMSAAVRNICGASGKRVAVFSVDFTREVWMIDMDSSIQDCNLYALSSCAFCVSLFGSN